MTLSIMTIGIMTLGIKTLSIMTLDIKTLSIMTFSIMTLVIKTLSIITLGIKTKICYLGQISQFISLYNQPTLRLKENHTRYNDTVNQPYNNQHYDIIEA